MNGRCTVPSPFGALTLHAQDGFITALTWEGGTAEDSPKGMEEAAAQLRDYVTGARKIFDLPLRIAGSDFQRAVCGAMLAIPYGQTRTYGDIARQLGAPAQAVGQACGANPIPVIIPCHRVMGASGLTGFSGAGGVETKVALLRLEGAMLI